MYFTGPARLRKEGRRVIPASDHSIVPWQKLKRRSYASMSEASTHAKPVVKLGLTGSIGVL